jgi:hypothetical protein
VAGEQPALQQLPLPTIPPFRVHISALERVEHRLTTGGNCVLLVHAVTPSSQWPAVQLGQARRTCA